MYILFNVRDIYKAIFYTILLIYLKTTNILDISWLFSFSPVIATGSILLICYLYCVIYNFIKLSKK